MRSGEPINRSRAIYAREHVGGDRRTGWRGSEKYLVNLTSFRKKSEEIRERKDEGLKRKKNREKERQRKVIAIIAHTVNESRDSYSVRAM